MHSKHRLHFTDAPSYISDVNVEIFGRVDTHRINSNITVTVPPIFLPLSQFSAHWIQWNVSAEPRVIKLQNQETGLFLRVYMQKTFELAVDCSALETNDDTNFLVEDLGTDGDFGERMRLWSVEHCTYLAAVPRLPRGSPFAVGVEDSAVPETVWEGLEVMDPQSIGSRQMKFDDWDLFLGVKEPVANGTLVGKWYVYPPIPNGFKWGRFKVTNDPRNVIYVYQNLETGRLLQLTEDCDESGCDVGFDANGVDVVAHHLPENRFEVFDHMVDWRLLRNVLCYENGNERCFLSCCNAAGVVCVDFPVYSPIKFY